MHLRRGFALVINFKVYPSCPAAAITKSRIGGRISVISCRKQGIFLISHRSTPLVGSRLLVNVLLPEELGDSLFFKKTVIG